MKKEQSLGRRRRRSLINPGKVTVPTKMQVPIFLIIHELKVRMIYESFRPIATIDCYLQTHLDRLILKTMKMWDGKDKTYEFYFDLMDKWTKPINSDPEVITRRALKIYHALIRMRDSRRHGKPISPK